MTEKMLEDRIAALEEQIGPAALEVAFGKQAEVIERMFARHFSEQAERIERLFTHRFEEPNRRLDTKLTTCPTDLKERIDGSFLSFEERIDQKFEAMRLDLGALRDAVRLVLERLP